jgi:hypothetical protein
MTGEPFRPGRYACNHARTNMETGMKPKLARMQTRPEPAVPAPGVVAAGPAANGAPSATEVYEMIREAAYYRAEKRGFAPGLEAEDWRQAEAEVMERITGRPYQPQA